MEELTDLRPLLEGVEEPAVLDYLSEAIVCFEASAFRACIVMTANAVFENIIGRVADFADFDTEAKKLKDRIDEDLTSQKAFEQHMISALFKAKFLNIDQRSALTRIRNARNKAAHPSRIRPTPEEAKDILRIAVVNFIRPVQLSASEESRRLVYDLRHDLVFPAKGDDAMVVRERLASIDKVAHSKLIADLWDELEHPTQEMFATNAYRFLAALAGTQDDLLRKQFTRLLTAGRKARAKGSAGNASEPVNDDSWLPRLLSLDPFLLTMVDGTARTFLDERLAQSFVLSPTAGQIKTDAVELFLAAIARSPLRKALVDSYAEAVSAAVDTVGLRGVLFGCLDEADILRDRTLAVVYNAWDDADSALLVAEMLPEIDGALAFGLSGQQVFDLVVSMCSFSRQMKETSLGKLATQGFATGPALRQKAIDFMDKHHEDAVETLEHHHMRGPAELVDTFLTPRRQGALFRKKAAV